MNPRAAELIATLQLRPHPEGGFYREIFRSATQVTTADARGTRAALTTIYFLAVCGSYGFAAASRLGPAQNTALRQCYSNGGRDCVIRAFVCDGKG